VQVNSSSAADSKAEEQGQVPLLQTEGMQQGAVQSMQAVEKPERKLKETRTFNPRKMRPKRSADSSHSTVVRGLRLFTHQLYSPVWGIDTSMWKAGNLLLSQRLLTLIGASHLCLQEERGACLAAAAWEQRLWRNHAAERHDVHDPEWQPRCTCASSGNSGFQRHHHHARCASTPPRM
jgi:hypothetical protein